MAFQTVWYFSDLPKDVVEILCNDLDKSYNDEMKTSVLHGDHIDDTQRNSKNAWIPSDHWVAGFLWHYVQKANRANFLYDLSHLDCESLQYTRYEVGDYYNWHIDSGLNVQHRPTYTHISAESSLDNDNFLQDKLKISSEFVRKLSFSLQLSHPDDYEGGNIQLMDENNRSYIAPRQRGSIILFDSRTPHRVLKVKKGERRSIVGWVCGPRWK